MASMTSGDGREAVTSVLSVSMLVDKISLTIYKLLMYDYLYLLVSQFPTASCNKQYNQNTYRSFLSSYRQWSAAWSVRCS